MASLDATRDSAIGRRSLIWRPRFRVYTLTVLIAMALFLPILDFTRRGYGSDFWWVWAAGRWMAEHHRILTMDPARWNGLASGTSWINLEWGWQLGLYLINPHQNPVAYLAFLVFMELLMMAACWWAIRAISPRLAPEIYTGLYLVYAAFAFSFTVKLRAELFSYVAFPLLIGILWRGRANPRWLWMLTPLAMLWANIHGSWLMIPALAGLQGLLSLTARESRRALSFFIVGGLLPVLAAIIATPFHAHTLTYAWWLDQNPNITTYIQEWQSINFHDTLFLLWGCAILAAWLWRARAGRRYPLLLDLWFLGITLAFFSEVRMITYFGEIFLFWMAYGVGQAEADPVWHSKTSGRRAAAWGVGLGVFIGMVVTIGWGSWQARSWTRPEVAPQAVSWLKHHPHHVVWNPVDVGGYLIAHGVSGVYLDGRADLFLAHGRRFQDYVRVVEQSERPSAVAAIFRTHHVDALVWPKDALNTNLAWFVARYHWHRRDARDGWVIWTAPPTSASRRGG